MIRAEAIVKGSYLQVNCTGTWGFDSQGAQCGDLLRDTIQHGMNEATIAVTDVWIDFIKVTYLGGDGPARAVVPSARMGVKLTYLVGEPSRQALQILLAVTHMDQFINVVVAGDA